MTRMTFKNRIAITIHQLNSLNTEFGQFLNDGLEDKVDQLQNLLTIQFNEIK